MTKNLKGEFATLRVEILRESKHVRILSRSHQNWRREQPQNQMRLGNFRRALSYHRVKLTNLLEQLEVLATQMRLRQDCQALLPEVDRLLDSDLPTASPQ